MADYTYENVMVSSEGSALRTPMVKKTIVEEQLISGESTDIFTNEAVAYKWLTTSIVLDNSPTKAEIEIAFIENGYVTLPTVDFGFILFDANEKTFVVSYIASKDNYYYEKLSKAL